MVRKFSRTQISRGFGERSAAGFVQDLSYTHFQRRKVALDDPPEDLNVDTEVFVHNYVAEAGCECP
jgi:hypothetical protein